MSEFPLERWPRRLPAATLISLLFGLAIFPAKVYSDARHWLPLQRFYLADYVRSAMPGIGKTGKFRLLQVQTASKPLFALDRSIIELELPKDHPKDAIPFALSTAGARQGGVGLRWENLEKADTKAVHAFLAHWVYEDQTLASLLVRPSLWAGFSFLFFLPLGIGKDLRRRREIRHGRQIRGPELVTRARFNQVMRSTGVGFQTNEPLDFYELLRDRTKRVRLREVDEFSHFLIIGDSGSGKSSLIRQMLTQIQLRQQTAIVYDPDCQFIRHFYNEARGDWVLNPVDARCPYWHPGDEITYPADTVAVASSLYSRDLKEPTFFMDSARDLMAELLKWNPSAADLAHWMAHPEEIDKRIAGTPLESVITHNAQGQRMGVLGTFNKISAAMNLLPAEAAGLRRWSANAWANDRQGWIFVTSTPEAREALRPLHSLWLDTLILRLLGTGQDSQHGVWIVLDELASLQKLPQLHTAITEGRKSKNRITIGIQGSAQLETLYGQMAVTMLSQPSTKILLRTSEPRAAKWMSDTIGEIEIERFRESRQASYGFGGGKSSKTYSQDRRNEPLVSAAQISGLPNMNGYLKSGNYVVQMSFPYLELLKTSPGLIRRDVNKIQFRKMNDLPVEPTPDTERLGLRDVSSAMTEKEPQEVKAEPQPVLEAVEPPGKPTGSRISGLLLRADDVTRQPHAKQQTLELLEQKETAPARPERELPAEKESQDAQNEQSRRGQETQQSALAQQL